MFRVPWYNLNSNPSLDSWRFLAEVRHRQRYVGRTTSTTRISYYTNVMPMNNMIVVCSSTRLGLTNVIMMSYPLQRTISSSGTPVNTSNIHGIYHVLYTMDIPWPLACMYHEPVYTSAKWGVHIFSKNAEYAHVTILYTWNWLHIFFCIFCIFVPYFFAYSAYYSAY